MRTQTLWRCDMAEPSKMPAKAETSRNSVPEIWRPFENLRREMDRLFDDFGAGLWHSPFRRALDLGPFRRSEVTVPAVDVSRRRIRATKSRLSYREWTKRA